MSYLHYHGPSTVRVLPNFLKLRLSSLSVIETNKISNISGIVHSSWIGRTTYCGFFLDWVNECSAATTYFLILTSSASLYVGMCFYIHGMDTDIEIQMSDINLLIKNGEINDNLHQLNVWWLFIREIRFHYEILQ